jgi:Fur family peroxide stress response transcriptional regulator
MKPASERAERLRAAGLKVTAPRLAILGALEQNRQHPSAEELHQGLAELHPSLSLSTVYVTLEAFVRAGLVNKMPEVDGRLRVDGIQQPHDHAICRRCGAIFDIDRDHFPLPSAPDRLPEGLEVLGVRVEYDVLCSSCGGES